MAILVLTVAGNSVVVAEITWPTIIGNGFSSAGDGETDRAVALTSNVSISAGRRELMMFSNSGSSSCSALIFRFKSGSLMVVVYEITGRVVGAVVGVVEVSGVGSAVRGIWPAVATARAENRERSATHLMRREKYIAN
ncbi:hypothetical protein BKA61DRAFT_590000 [Leptodontidium sp. MPI-SDFR-AT-0119]|nr:hypothetical protein BKA61DRAFT_590000 [Leptodontidium sp. MPI-SDFR-AT-0119]